MEQTKNSKKNLAIETVQAVTESQDTDDFTPNYLHPAKLRLTRSPVGAARLEIQDQVCYLRIIARRLTPLSTPERYISLAADEDTEIGIIVNPAQLDPQSLTILQEELDKRYFTPIIQKIYRVKEQFGIHEWEVKTARGRVKFSVRGLNQNVKQVPPARLFVTDVRGNRYDIPDYRKLDIQSFQKIQRYL